jgi:hypothetical protein
VVWGRWHVPWDLREVPDPEQTDEGKAVVLALGSLGDAARSHREFVVPDAEGLVDEHRRLHPRTPRLDELIASAMVVREQREVRIVRHSPTLRAHGAWLAARLWDRDDCGPHGPERLSWWRDRVFELDAEWHEFGEYLGEEAREEFEKQAWDQVLAEDDLIGWNRERERYAAQAAAASGFGEVERGLAIIGAAPSADPIARTKWLARATDTNWTRECRNEIGALIWPLVRWRAKFRSRGPWDTWINDIVKASADRPYLVHTVDDAIHTDPAIAADFLLVPEAVALGLGSLADQVFSSGRGWNWEAKETARRETEQSVWQDVVECAAHSLHKLPPEDAAALIASVLELFASLARPSVSGDPGRSEQLRFRYGLLRGALTRWAHGTGEHLPFDRLGAETTGHLVSMLDSMDLPIEAPAFDVLTWMAALGADDKSPWRPDAVCATVDTYGSALKGLTAWYHDVPPEPRIWLRLARWLVENDQRTWRALLEPTDFDALAREVGLLGEGARYSAWRSLIHRVRTHALLLLTLATHWDEVRRSEAVPPELEEGVVRLLEHWLPAQGGRPSLIAADVDIGHMFERRRESLLVGIAMALPRVSGTCRKAVMSILLPALTEVRQIATLQSALSDGPERDAVREHLASLPISQGTADVHHLDEVRRSVDALLDAGEVDRAEVWLEAWAEKARARRIHDWARWEVGARQRVRFARRRFEEAANEPLPVWAANDIDAQHSNDFFRGVAMLHLDPPRPDDAAKIYEALLRDAPHQPSYAVNLFAARTRLLTAGPDDQPLTPEEDDALRELLVFGESLLAGFSAEQRAAVEQTYQVNRLYLFHRLRDWPAMLSAYQTLPSALQKSPDLASYAASALESSGQPFLAAALRVDTGAEGGEMAVPHGTGQPDRVEAARLAILRIPEFAMHEQALAWWDKELADAVVDAVLDACRALTDIAPALAVPKESEAHEEDRVTKLLAELLRQRLLKLHWQVSSQEHGGYTDKDPSSGRGGIGELDLEIRAGSAHVAVGEAVIARQFERGDLTRHVRKLFGYAPSGTPVVFLLIWSYATDPGSVWKRYHEDVAAKEAPAGREFRSWVAPPEGPTSHVWHAVSEHAHPDSGTCRVGHMLVDLQQTARKSAAVAARQ